MNLEEPSPSYKSNGTAKKIIWGKRTRPTQDQSKLFEGCLYSTFVKNSNKLPVKTVLMIVIQLLEQLEGYHGKDKCSGRLEMKHIEVRSCEQRDYVYLSPTAFGLSQDCDDQDSSRIITSINYDRGLTTTKRDDLECIAYLAILLLKGTVPWIKYCDATGTQTGKKVAREKENYGWKMLSKGLPVEVSLFLKYLNDLDEKSSISYEICKECFYSDVLQCFIGLPCQNFDLVWRDEESVVSRSNASDEFSLDSSESFDPMAAKIVEHQAMEYRKKASVPVRKTFNMNTIEEEKGFPGITKHNPDNHSKKYSHPDRLFQKEFIKDDDAQVDFRHLGDEVGGIAGKTSSKAGQMDANNLYSSSSNINFASESLVKHKIREFTHHPSVFMRHKKVI
ncbi:unnamed protein product [Moneuplotes crassus]|uniref:Uncharacterized protein n=1 Tax=Euplotes crassus TaxID=5936 RepID=A0AAD2D7G5_EUPCR|nr:unnamed protein product [Moneuplotes crassus]